MDIKLFNNNLKEIKLQRNYSLCLNIFLAAMLFLCALVILKRANVTNTIVVPAGFYDKFEVGSNGVSESYLSQWTEFITLLKLNITPSNVNNKQNTLLSYVDASQYGEIKNHLTAEQERIQKDDITTVFFPSQTKILDKNKLITRISGLLRVYIGNEVNREITTSYELEFKYYDNRLLLTSFKENQSA